MNEIIIKIINKSGNELPDYATPGAAGMDLRAFIDEPITLKSLERKLIPTGLFIEIPEGYEAQVRPRSGLAIKHGLTCLNSPGTVDSDYRGELKVILINLSQEEHIVENGDRIAQMVFSKVQKASLQPVTDLEATIRNDGGFGHTGHN